MKPRRTFTSNTVLRLEGGNEDNDLWARRDRDQDGNPVIFSVWELNDAERQAIAEGGKIELCVWAVRPPPVSLAVTHEAVGRRPGA